MWHSVTLNRFTITSSQTKLCGFKVSRPVYWPLRFQCIRFFINPRVKGLSALPTSVPSKRLFSGAGILYDEQRNRLSTEHAEMLLCIKYNNKLEIFEVFEHDLLINNTSVNL